MNTNLTHVVYAYIEIPVYEIIILFITDTLGSCLN